MDRVQTSNGEKLGSALHWHILDEATGHGYTKPRAPLLNGRLGRSYRIDSEGFYQLLVGRVIDDTQLFTEKLSEWEGYCYYHRGPHGAFGGRAPFECRRQRIQGPRSPASVSCTLIRSAT